VFSGCLRVDVRQGETGAIGESAASIGRDGTTFAGRFGASERDLADSLVFGRHNPFACNRLRDRIPSMDMNRVQSQQFCVREKNHPNCWVRLQKNLSFDVDLTLQYFWDESSLHIRAASSESFAEALAGFHPPIPSQ